MPRTQRDPTTSSANRSSPYDGIVRIATEIAIKHPRQASSLLAVAADLSAVYAPQPPSSAVIVTLPSPSPTVRVALPPPPAPAGSMPPPLARVPQLNAGAQTSTGIAPHPDMLAFAVNCSQQISISDVTHRMITAVSSMGKNDLCRVALKLSPDNQVQGQEITTVHGIKMLRCGANLFLYFTWKNETGPIVEWLKAQNFTVVAVSVETGISTDVKAVVDDVMKALASVLLQLGFVSVPGDRKFQFLKGGRPWVEVVVVYKGDSVKIQMHGRMPPEEQRPIWDVILGALPPVDQDTPRTQAAKALGLMAEELVKEPDSPATRTRSKTGPSTTGESMEEVD